jgi:hypothetical protein
MKGRRLIKSQIVDAWVDCVENDYASQRINSERSLQAAFWAHLNERLPANRRLFIEPGISLCTRHGSKKIIPDIVVCNSREVIAVIELKYRPQGPPSYLKDIRTLDLIARNRGAITIANSRYSGPKSDAREYTCSSRILFVWAGVHHALSDDNTALYSDDYPALSGSFLQLHAATSRNDSPDIYYYESMG